MSVILPEGLLYIGGSRQQKQKYRYTNAYYNKNIKIKILTSTLLLRRRGGSSYALEGADIGFLYMYQYSSVQQ